MSPEVVASSLRTKVLPLEDEASDVLRKAMRGQNHTLESLSERLFCSPQEVEALLSEPQRNVKRLQEAAFVLNLSPERLEALAKGDATPPSIPEIPGFAMFTTPFGDMTVNAFMVWDIETHQAASFDTGATCTPMLEHIQDLGLTLHRVFITHTHLDHLYDLKRLLTETGGTGYGPAIENPLGLRPIQHQEGFTLGQLKIRVLGTPGHTPGGTSYFIEGLSRPIVVVGDALFARSMGGAPLAYEQARSMIRERILTLPPHTIIAPGHGPLTTVSDERAHNPFFPELS